MDFFADVILSNWVFVYFVAAAASTLPNPLYLFYFIIVIYYGFLFGASILYPQYILYCAAAAGGAIFTKIIPAWICTKWETNTPPRIDFTIGFLLVYFTWLSVRNITVFEVYEKMIRYGTEIPFCVKNIPRILLVGLGVR